ncbi:hypothetical protein EII14_00865 [Alloprevotella sp. OH1205_COT-284]|uniref:carbohydrate binding domain-containing protein n=1 Tax=Alloprevotella sp. OH1205_COT-284 TaxID=2491043 RepID=UPI000F5EF54C|nr:carbohydrate binding domain-containing protein [Alloprevotella sp. OH1205_COT-284]RRD80887.1 hypothetical protein EII14_00865 [Alloprevotella sp. OH1205_COT-284]
MKKTLLTLFVAAMATVGVNAQNLVKNGDFEAWENDLPTEWAPKDKTDAPTATNIVAKVVEAGRSGKAVEISDSKYKDNYQNTRLSQKVELEAGEYVITFYAKGAVEGKKAVAGYATELKASGYKYGKKIDLSTTEWTKITMEFKLTEKKEIWVLARNDKSSGGSIFVDDFTLSKKAPTAIEKAETRKGVDVIFDLSGRRVQKAENGIFIINGVKRVVK